MINKFEGDLTGGHPNSLGNTVQVVDQILADRSKLEDLYQCYFSEDEIVRLRVSNAFKRVCKEQPQWVAEYLDRFLDVIYQIDQPSAKWSLAQMFLWLDSELSDEQKEKAVKILKHNLQTEDDWIVQNFTMETLKEWSKSDKSLKKWLIPQLEKNTKRPQKSVAKRAQKYLDELS